MLTSAFLAFVAFSGLSIADTSAGQSSMTETVNLNDTKAGERNVAAAGQLNPFGDVGIGCGINWNESVSYGGGLQAGSKDFGLGGGYTIKPDSFEIGAGVGTKAANESASIQFSGTTNGSFEIVFEASNAFVCTPGTKDGKFNVRCTTV